MKIIVNNYFRDEKHIKERINSAFADICRRALLDNGTDDVVSCSKDLPRHDASPPQIAR